MPAVEATASRTNVEAERSAHQLGGLAVAFDDC